MTIEEILKAAGVESPEVIAAVKKAMPESFIPLAEANKRIAAAKEKAEETQAAFDAYKEQAEKDLQEAKDANAGKDDEHAQKLAELQEKFDKLQGDYTDSQNRHKQRKATDALTDALKKAGANPAALALLAKDGLGRIEYGDDGEPSNVPAVADAIKEANAGLFGEAIDTGNEPGKAGGKNEPADPFLKGFGKLN